MRHRAVIVAACMVMFSSCKSFYPVRPNEQIAPEATVAVTFASPRDLEATFYTVVFALPAVRKVYGRVEQVRSDTLVVRVLLVESDKPQPELPRNARLALVPDASARVTTRRTSGGKTVALVAGLTLLGLLGLLAHTLANYEF